MVPGEWFGGPLYGVRRVGPAEFRVAKFDGHQEPDAVYEVTDRGDSAWRCTCPGAFRQHGNCKHARLVRAAKRAGRAVRAVDRRRGRIRPGRLVPRLRSLGMTPQMKQALKELERAIAEDLDESPLQETATDLFRVLADLIENQTEKQA
jgi:hypothetical protein